jgi:hypothetical protein
MRTERLLLLRVNRAESGRRAEVRRAWCPCSRRAPVTPRVTRFISIRCEFSFTLATMAPWNTRRPAAVRPSTHRKGQRLSSGRIRSHRRASPRAPASWRGRDTTDWNDTTGARAAPLPPALEMRRQIARESGEN